MPRWRRAGSGYTLGCGYTTPISPFAHIVNNNDVGRARYDSLQLKAESRSTRHGLYFLLGYTWARTFDSGFSDGLGSFPGAIYWPLPGMDKADWSLSALNVNNTFTAGVIYDLPFGKGKRSATAGTEPGMRSWEIGRSTLSRGRFPAFRFS